MIYLDACLLIYVFEAHPAFGPVVRHALARHAADEFAISPLTKLECLVAPVRSANVALQRRYEQAFETFTWLPMNDTVFDLATQLRARHRLRAPDALHLASAQHYGCHALWTNDDRLTKAGHGLAVNALKPGRR